MMNWPVMNLSGGPVEMTSRTLRDMARPMMYHYDPAFMSFLTTPANCCNKFIGPSMMWSSCRARLCWGWRRRRPV